MKARTCFTEELDPYRAGVEIARQLDGMQPEVVFLFASIHYKDASELPEAILAALSPCRPLLTGSTGFGVYAMNRAEEVGVSALALDSGGRVRWHAACREGVAGDPCGATQACLAELLDSCRERPKLLFLSTITGTDPMAVLRALAGTDIPVVGGLAGGDYKHFQECGVFFDDRARSDAITLLGAEGDLEFEVRLANNPECIGHPGVITSVEGNHLLEVDGIPVMDFMERECGKPLDQVDQGNLTFRAFHPDHPEEYRVRAMLLPENRAERRGVWYQGGVSAGEMMQLCVYPRENMITDVDKIADRVAQGAFKPDAALVVSCFGRKTVLGDAVTTEATRLLERIPSLQALAGYPSFGEFAPIQRDKRLISNHFHNMTYVLILLGSPSA